MFRTKKLLRRLGVLAGLLTLSLSATAFDSDATISIDRALNSPTLTIHYSGAAAALAELRINGESYGTRVLNPANTSGDTDFTLSTTNLNEGENEIEVRLFDKNGTLVGTQHTSVVAEKPRLADVYLSTPKVGQTLQGPVEIKVGFGHELKNIYVSFFVDNQFKLMTNFPPYNYTWDTMRENNGWHEVEAWVVDDTSATFKTKKVRVFVNNPSGHTARIFAPKAPAPAPAPAKAVPAKPAPAPAAKPVAVQFPALLTEILLNPSRPLPVMGSYSNLKLSPLENPVFTGLRFLTPTGTRVAITPVASAVGNPVAQNVASGAAGLKVTPDAGPGVAVTEPTALLAPKVQPVPVAVVTVAKPAPKAVPAPKLAPKAQPVTMALPKPTEPKPPVAPKPAPAPKLVAAAPKAVVAKVPAPAPVKPVLAPRAAVVAKPTPVAIAPKARPAIRSITKTVTTLVKIEPGVRIPHKGNYAVMLDGKLVEFDVQPRVDEGVPMTPFRHLVEKEGGTVNWEAQEKAVTAKADGRSIMLQIGTKIATIDHSQVEMELAPYIERGRTIVPLSFMRDSLHVNIEYDKATNHVLITSIKD